MQCLALEVSHKASRADFVVYGLTVALMWETEARKRGSGHSATLVLSCVGVSHRLWDHAFGTAHH